MGRAEILLVVAFSSLVLFKLSITTLSPSTYRYLSQDFINTRDFFVYGFTQALQDCYDAFDLAFFACDQLLHTVIPAWIKRITWAGIAYVTCRVAFLVALWLILRLQYHIICQYWPLIEVWWHRGRSPHGRHIPQDSGMLEASSAPDPGPATESAPAVSGILPSVLDIDEIVSDSEASTPCYSTARHSLDLGGPRTEAVDDEHSVRSMSVTSSVTDHCPPSSSAASERKFWEESYNDQKAYY